MDQELKAYLDESFGRLQEQVNENSRQIEGLREETRQLREETRELREESRHTGISVEAVRSDVRLIAEGLVGMSERLEAFKIQVDKGFEDVKASIAPAYRDLDRRVQWLEARAERQDRDVLEVVREKFGIPKA